MFVGGAFLDHVYDYQPCIQVVGVLRSVCACYDDLATNFALLHYDALSRSRSGLFSASTAGGHLTAVVSQRLADVRVGLASVWAILIVAKAFETRWLKSPDVELSGGSDVGD